MSSDKSYKIWIFLSCGEDQGTCFGTLELVSFLELLVSTLRSVVYIFCHRLFSCTAAPVRNYCNAQYSVFCSYFFSFLLWQATQFSMSFASLPHSSSFLCCHVFLFPFYSTPLLTFHSHLSSLPCLLSLLVVCYTFPLITKGVLWGSWNSCRLRYCLKRCLDAVCQYFHFSATPSKFLYTLKIFFFFWIQLHGFKYVPNQRQETCKLKTQ